jgi:hypothetical protein
MPRKARRTGKQGRKVLPAAAVTLAPAPRDLGASGPANRLNLVVEPVKDSPNGEKRARRIDMLESYHNRGIISQRQHDAGKVLREAWLRTEMGPVLDLTQPRVDKSPDPGRAVTIAIDALSRYIGVARKVEARDGLLLYIVACLGRPVSRLPQYQGHGVARGKEHLAEALERLANALRM